MGSTRVSVRSYMVFTCKVVELRGAASARAAAVTTGSSPEALLLELRFTRLAAVTTYTQHPKVHVLVCSFCLAKGSRIWSPCSCRCCWLAVDFAKCHQSWLGTRQVTKPFKRGEFAQKSGVACLEDPRRPPTDAPQ